MHKYKFYKSCTLLLACFFSSAGNAGLSSLSLSQKMLIIENSKTASITVTNESKVATSYRMSFSDIPNHKAAVGTLKLFPKQAKLPPNASQTIRIISTSKNQNFDEVASYLTITALPVEQRSVLTKNKTKEGVVSGSAQAVWRVQVPIIVRTGKPEADIKITKVSAIENNALSVQLEKTGNRSVFGQIKASLADDTQLGIAKGFLLGGKLQNTAASLPIVWPEHLPPGEHTVQVEFSGIEGDRGKYQTQTTAKITLPPAHTK